MARKWTNSKGIGYDHERNLERSLDRLRREVMKPEVYQTKYRKNNQRTRKR